MPIVPRVRPAPLPGARVSAGTPAAPPAAAFGGGSGNAAAALDLSPIAREAQRIALQEKARTSEALLDTGRVAVGDLRQNLAAKFESLQGLDAPAQQEAYRQEWQQGVAKVREALPSDELRAAFDHVTTGDHLNFNETLVRHGMSQMAAADRTNFIARKQQLLNDAIANAGDDAATKATLDEMTGLVHDHASRSGESAIATETEAANERSVIHRAVLASLTAKGADLGAQRYLELHAGELFGEDRIKATATVREASVRGESQRQFDRIVYNPQIPAGASPADAARATLDQPMPTLKEALEAARKIPDVEVRDQTTTRIEHWFSVKESVDREQHEADYRGAIDRVEKTGDALSVAPDLWHTLSLGERDGLLRKAESIVKGKPIQTDQNLYWALRFAATSEDPKERERFMHMNLGQHLADIAGPDLERLQGLQDGLRKGDEKSRDNIAGLRTRDEIARQTFDAAIAAPKGNDPEKKRQHNAEWLQFNTALDARITQFSTDNNGKRPDPEILQRFVDDLVINAATSKGEQRRVFDARPGEQLVFSIKDVPFTERRRITTYLQGRGLPVTDANVLKLFTQSISNTVPPRAP